MAQHDYIIANQSGAAFRSDLNNGLAAIVSQNSGAAQPSTTYSYQWWADTTTGLLKLRNAANNAWITIGTLASANLGLLSLAGGTLTGALLLDDAANTASAPALAFDGDTNTGIYRSAADRLNIATNGVENVEFAAAEVVFNDGGADIDFRVEGDTKANLFKVDAGVDTVAIDGTAQLANQTPLRFGDGDNSHYVGLRAAATVAANVTFTLPTADGTNGQAIVTNGSGTLSFGSTPQLVLATSVASTSGTSIDFTGIPSWVKRITVMFNGVSTNGTSNLLIQIGAGSVDTSGYNSTALYAETTAVAHINSTAGFVLKTYAITDTKSGVIQFCGLGSNVWVASGWLKISTTQSTSTLGDRSLSGTLDRIRITTVNGTDTFDAGSINILYEG